MLVDVIDFRLIGPYSLELTFETGEHKRINLLPDLRGPVFEPLHDPAYFAQVRLKYGTITWPNGADFDPEFLYEHAEEPQVAFPLKMLNFVMTATTQTYSGHPANVYPGRRISKTGTVLAVTALGHFPIEPQQRRQLVWIDSAGVFQTRQAEPVPALIPSIGK